MKINIAKIKQTTGLSIKFAIEEKPQNLQFEEEQVNFKDPLKVTGEVFNAGDMFTVSGQAETTLELVCSRCLETFMLPLKVDFDGVYSQNQTADDEVRYFNGDEISLDDVVIEAIMLELPIKYLCNDDCKGLCMQCGKNLNHEKCDCQKQVDPRLAILGDLLKDKSKGV